jgi:hypothetical protein
MKTIHLNTTKLALASFLFLVCNMHPLVAQEKTEPNSQACGPQYCGGFGYFTFSSEMINTSELNHSLEQSGYAAFGPSMPSWGGGGMFVIHNFMIGGQGAGYFGQQRSSDISTADLRGGYGQASIGYLFRTTKRSVLFPVIGIGGGGMTLNTGPNSSPGDFSQQLKSPSGTLSASAGGWFLTAELTFNHFFLASELQGFFIGARAGYRYSPESWKFTNNGNAYGNSPGINMNGLYLTLLIGGGGIGH